VTRIIGSGLLGVNGDALVSPRGRALLYVLRFALIVVYTVFWGIPAMLVAPFSGEAIVWIGRTWLSWIFHACGIRVVAEGLEHIDRTQPYVIMSNHQSVLDVGALVLTLPVSWRFVAKRELTYVPFFGWALGLSDQVVIDRGNRTRSMQSLARAAERIRGGINVIIFPEGTRSETGELGEFKSGGFHLAIQAQVPILPATVSGSFELIPKRSLRIHSGTIRVVYGTPIPTTGFTSDQRSELKERVRAAIARGFDAPLQRARAEVSVSLTRGGPPVPSPRYPSQG
jgi:1-acyl-sn-glycerol-3-phosphate acyltransferase